MKLQNTKLLALAVIFFSSISLDAFADKDVLSAEDIAVIENRIDKMSISELNTQRESLTEVAYLQAEQGASQESRAISSRLSQITAELSLIQKALIGLGSIAILNNLADDGYNDNTPPVTINGSSSVTAELGTAYSDAGATANDAFTDQLPFPFLVVLIQM